MKHINLLVLLSVFALHASAQCFNMTDLYDPSITCTYGRYENPYANIGVQSGRHTVMTDVNGKDENVPQLSVIPPGESSSIRLGNDGTNYQAESITFEYTVDPVNTILLLKYAAVMEDPNHSSYEQPRLRLEVFDIYNNAIDPACSSFDFVANASLGWNSMNSGNLLWKDWTSIGVDLEQYVGQTVKIRLTTYDCNQGGHFGYAYFHLGCTTKKIISLACGDVQSTTYQAPAGFDYLWYTYKNGVSQSYGNRQTVTVPIDGNTYYCDISQVGKPNCKFTLSVTAQPRYPIADFSLRKVSSCVDTIWLTNLSGVSQDGVSKNIPLEPCDSAVWDLGDGRILNSYDLSSTPITYAKGGEYTITLTSYLTDGGCYDTISKKVIVDGYNDVHELNVSAVTCDNEPYDFYGQSLSQAGVYTHMLKTAKGCDSIVTLSLSLNPSYNYDFYDTICDGQTYIWNQVKYKTPGNYTQSFKTISGCDSVVTLNLVVNPIYDIEIYDTICAGETYKWNAEQYTQSGSYMQSFTTQHGCDSLVTLHLSVGDVYNVSLYDTICSGEIYNWDGKSYTNTGVYVRKYASVLGCDSIVTLNLLVGEVYDIQLYDTICQGETYVWNNVKYTKSGSYTQPFTSQHGCDSIVTVHLFIAPIVRETYVEAICQDQPYTFGKKILTQPGTYVDTTLSMYGCDSITTLTLRVHEPYLIDQYIEVCHDDTFNFRGQVVEKPGIYYDSLLTQHGCDSVYRLIFNKTPTYLFHSEDTMCVGSTYTYRGKLLTQPGTYYDSLTTVSGCDSIYRLVLHTHPTYLIYALQTEDVCGDASTYEMVVQYDGARPSHYNLLYSEKAKEQGFRDILLAPFVNDTLNLPIPHATPYVRPDYYDVTLQLINSTCPDVSSEHETDLLVRYPSWIIEQNWQDVVAVKNARYNGGYYFQGYDWHVNNVSTTQTDSYLYLPSLQVGDEVVLYATRMGEDYAVPTCPIVIEPQNVYEQEHPVPVYPTRLTRSNRNITIGYANTDSQYYVYDVLGRQLASGVCGASEKAVLELPDVSGSYFVMIIDSSEQKQVVHVMVE